MDAPTYEQLRTEVEAGGRNLTGAERRELAIDQLLALQAIERAALWRMSPQARLRRAAAGELTLYQRGVWAQGAPEEIPWVNRGIEGAGGIPPWIAATLCDIVDEGQG